MNREDKAQQKQAAKQFSEEANSQLLVDDPENDNSTRSQVKTQEDEKESKMYILLTLIAAILMALTSLLRTVESDTAYERFYVLSLAYLLISGSILILVNCTVENPQLAWYEIRRPDPPQFESQDASTSADTVTEPELRFSPYLFTMLMLGGVAEFITSLFSILALDQAIEYGVNAGVSQILLPMSGFLVALISYICFDEGMKFLQIVGMLFIIAGASLISLYPEEDMQTDSSTSTLQVLSCIGLGFLAALGLTAHFVIVKILTRRDIDCRFLGFSFMACEGVLGTIILLIETMLGRGLLTISSETMVLMFAAGATGVSSIALLQYCFSVGRAGVVGSLFNTDSAFMVTFCYFYWGQCITVMQLTGIIIVLIGATSISLDKETIRQILCCCCGRGREQARVQTNHGIQLG